MGTKNNPGAFDCYANAHPDEPMFVLLGRDPLAPSLVTLWAQARDTMADARPDPDREREKIAESMTCIDAMKQWLYEHRREEVAVLDMLPFDILATALRRRGAIVTPVPHGGDASDEPVPNDASPTALADELSLLLEDENLDEDKLTAAAADLLPRIHDFLRSLTLVATAEEPPIGYVDRMREEHAALAVRLERLSAFCSARGGIFDSLPTEEKQRLTEQEGHMAAYLRVLGERIEAAS